MKCMPMSSLRVIYGFSGGMFAIKSGPMLDESGHKMNVFQTQTCSDVLYSRDQKTLLR